MFRKATVEFFFFNQTKHTDMLYKLLILFSPKRTAKVDSNFKYDDCATYKTVLSGVEALPRLDHPGTHNIHHVTGDYVTIYLVISSQGKTVS